MPVPWERDELPDPLDLPQGPVGPLSALTERYQHAVLLQPGPDGETVVDAAVTWAFRKNRPDFRDPYLIWDETKDRQLHARDAKAERSLWRDPDTLVLKKRSGAGRRPPILDGLAGGQIPGDVFRSLRRREARRQGAPGKQRSLARRRAFGVLAGRGGAVMACDWSRGPCF
ncbi:type I-E CRISPR-associated protein Cse1/CasA [Streptomyces scopuliridis]